MSEMKLEIIKTEKGLIAVSDEEIKKGDFYINTEIKDVFIFDIGHVLFPEHKKIVLTDASFELEGVMQFEVEDESDKSNGYSVYGKPLGEKYLAFKEGYKTAQSKYKYTEEDLIEAFKAGVEYQETKNQGIGRTYSSDEYIQHLNQPKQLKYIEVDSLEATNGIVTVKEYYYA